MTISIHMYMYLIWHLHILFKPLFVQHSLLTSHFLFTYMYMYVPIHAYFWPLTEILKHTAVHHHSYWTNTHVMYIGTCARHAPRLCTHSNTRKESTCTYMYVCVGMQYMYNMCTWVYKTITQSLGREPPLGLDVKQSPNVQYNMYVPLFFQLGHLRHTYYKYMYMYLYIHMHIHIVVVHVYTSIMCIIVATPTIGYMRHHNKVLVACPYIQLYLCIHLIA